MAVNLVTSPETYGSQILHIAGLLQYHASSSTII